MIKRRRVPIIQGFKENEKTIGQVTIIASDQQADIQHLGILVPNYEPTATGQKVVSYSLVPRTDVLKPELLKRIATLENKANLHYEQQQQRDTVRGRTDNAAGTGGAEDAPKPQQDKAA